MPLKIISTIIILFMINGCASINKNDAEVTHNACYSYMYGKNSFEKDYSKALEWCQKSSDLNISSGHTLLAEIYFFGYGINQDLEKSATIYEMAALQGHPHAQFMVFQIYNVYLAESSSIDQKATGLILLKRAYNSNYPKAVEIYNKLYEQKI